MILVALVSGGLALQSETPASADEFDQQIAALQAQAGALQNQIAGLQAQSSAATAQAVATEQALAGTQAKVAAAQAQLAAVNQQLATTTARLVAKQEQLRSDEAQLSRMMVTMYELRSSDTVTHALVNSSSFVDAMSTLTTTEQMSDRMQTLVSGVREEAGQLNELRNAQQQQQEEATQLVDTLQQLAAQQAAEEQAFQAQASVLNGAAATTLQQLNDVQSQIAQLRAEQAAAREASARAAAIQGGALPPFAFGPRYDGFPWGQCTWYVASLRDASWNGDAWAWAGTAAAAGASEGMSPRPGAIVVFGAGNGYSGFGHVAYVVAVQSATSFTVDEANYIGLGIVDRRHINSLFDVEAFIY